MSITLFAFACAIIAQLNPLHSLTPQAILLWAGTSLMAGAGVVVLWGFNRRTAWISVILSWTLVAFLLGFYGGPSRQKTTPPAAPPAGQAILAE